MKHSTTIVVAAAVSILAITCSAAQARVIEMRKYSEGELKSSCVRAGGTWNSGVGGYGCSGKKGQVLCKRNEKNCYGYTDSSANQKTPPTLASVLDQVTGKKRPKVLQEGGSGGEPGDVRPTVLGGGNPRKTPTGDMQDITGDGGIQ